LNARMLLWGWGARVGPAARLGVALVSCGIAASGARAQATPGPAKGGPANGTSGLGVPPAVATTLQEFTAGLVTRAAMLDLRMVPRPTPADYSIASYVLGVAGALSPADTDIIRRRIEAAYSAGDEGTVNELTRQLVRLEPTDTVAQLRLLSTVAGRAQTADARLEAYERILGAQGSGIDASVLSRLALDAALLLQERGDAQGFVAKLSQATRLDPTNKEAASLALAYFSEHLSDAMGRLDLISNLLFADPVDPNVHLLLARELAAGGALDAARRFHRLANALFSGAGSNDETRTVEAMVLNWQLDGPKKVFDELDKQLVTAREQQRRLIKQMTAAKRPTDGVMKPEDVRLAAAYESIRILTADALGDRAKVQESISDLEKSVEDEIAARAEAIKKMAEKSGPGAAAPQPPSGATPAELHAIVCRVKLWTGTVDDKSLAEARKLTGADLGDQRATILGGWIALRSGHADEAVRTLEPLAEADAFAGLGLGVGLMELGRKEEAVEAYRRVAARSPLVPEGAWARSVLITLKALPETLTNLEAPMRSFAAGIPAWVDEMTRSPGSFMVLRLELLKNTLGATEKSGVRVFLQNIAPIPLGLGADRTLNSRLLLMPKLESVSSAAAKGVRPEVVDLDRRLRLLPRETLAFTVWPECGWTGWMLQTLAGQVSRVRWRALQGFMVGQTGVYEPGQLCLTAETESQIRGSLPLARGSGEELAQRVAQASESELQDVGVAVMGAMLQPGGKMTDADRKRVGDAAAARLTGLSPQARLLLVAVLPHAVLAPGMEAFDEAAKADADPMVAGIALVTRVRSAEDPALEKARQSPDAGLRAVAEQVRTRAAAGTMCYARMTPFQALSGGQPEEPKKPEPAKPESKP
jgi:hypothetical protein